MGTSLVERGAQPSACLEVYNLRAPDLVGDVHRAFAEAGSSLLLTNTFGANRFKLARHGLLDHVADVNAAGVEIARSVGSRVAGSVGPLGVRLAPYGRVSPAEALDVYREQVSALAGVELIIIETQSDLNEMEQALCAAREACDLPVVVSASFTGDDRTLLDHTPEQVAARLVELGVDGIGINCGQGPAQALRVVRAMRPYVGEVPMVVRPNAGGPRQVGDRLMFPATPDYFADHVRQLIAEGVLVVGGCCGTTPSHTRAMAAALEEPRARVIEVVQAERVEGAVLTATPPASEFATRLAAGDYVVAVEMDPPRGFSAAKMLAGAETMRDAGADVIDVADSPMARMRMSPWAACRLIQEHAGIETVLHFPTRGRNLLRLQGDLLAVHALGIRNVLVCFGDPVSIGDFPEAMDDYDVVPTGLMRLITQSFNRGMDHSGASIGEPTNYFTGCVVSPNAQDLDKEIRLLRKKVEAGAAFALSQPLFGPEPLLALREAWERTQDRELDIPILAGILPLANARHAAFLHNEVPGIRIPEGIQDRLERAGDGAEAEGCRMAGEVAASLRGAAAGVYLMPQFGRYDIAAEVCEAAKRG
jgi:methionine synthase / methylenetetrahydrofolate reductase(NADPH)